MSGLLFGDRIWPTDDAFGLDEYVEGAKNRISRGEEKMAKVFILSACLAASLLSFDARAQGARQYSDGPVTEVQYLRVDYGHFETYVDWLNSTWKPTMEAAKKAKLILDYKVFRATPKSPDQPNVYLFITFKNMAATIGDNGDKADEFEAVTEKVIGTLEFQNKKREERGAYRKVIGTELIREVVLK